MSNRYIDYFSTVGEADMSRISTEAKRRSDKVAEIEQGSHVPSLLTEEQQAIEKHARPARFPLATPPRMLTD